MHVLIDHLSSTLIGTVVLLMLLGIGLRLSEAGTDQQIYETSQRMSQSLAQQLEGDLLNVGYGLPPSTKPLVSWTDSTFTFRRRAGEATSDPILTIEYRRAVTGYVNVEGVTRPVYTLERYENGVRLGGTPSALSSFELDLLNSSGTRTFDVNQATSIRTKFELLFLHSNNSDNNNISRYNRIFYPENIK